MLQKIVHITPALPPSINGVGDFSALLVKNFGKKGYNNNLFFVAKHEDGYEHYDNVCVFSQKDFYAKITALNPASIILHYAGYSYDEKGLPFYMVKALKRYKERTGCKVLVFFHELYSSSNSLFKLSFYTNPFQKKIIRELYAIADQTFTNCSWYQQLLEQLIRRYPSKNIVTGIYSNVSDEWYDAANQKQNDTAIVFGSFERRKAVYQNDQLSALLRNAGVKQIFDIGPGKPAVDLAQVQLILKGCLQAEEAAVYFNKARFGLIDYPPGLLGKSGIFAAYCAFGLIPINTYAKQEGVRDDLKEGINYFNLKSSFNPSTFDQTKLHITDWYKGRNQKAVTENILKFI